MIVRVVVSTVVPVTVIPMYCWMVRPVGFVDGVRGGRWKELDIRLVVVYISFVVLGEYVFYCPLAKTIVNSTSVEFLVLDVRI
jgi:hypothetical protein